MGTKRFSWLIPVAVLLAIGAGAAVGLLLRPVAPAGWLPLAAPGGSLEVLAAYVTYEGHSAAEVASWYADALAAEAVFSTECSNGDVCFTITAQVAGQTVQVQGSGFTPLATVLVTVGTVEEGD